MRSGSAATDVDEIMPAGGEGLERERGMLRLSLGQVPERDHERRKRRSLHDDDAEPTSRITAGLLQAKTRPGSGRPAAAAL